MPSGFTIPILAIKTWVSYESAFYVIGLVHLSRLLVFPANTKYFSFSTLWHSSNFFSQLFTSLLHISECNGMNKYHITLVHTFNCHVVNVSVIF